MEPGAELFKVQYFKVMAAAPFMWLSVWNEIFFVIIRQRFDGFVLNSAVTLTVVCLTQADRSGPNFSSVYKNTEQMVNVSPSSSPCLVLHHIPFVFGVVESP